MKREKIVIIDGNSLMNRAFYALPPLTNSRGIHTNAVYGFTTMLFKIINDEKPDYVVSAFDRKAPTFRHKEYAEYKAGRKKTPPELVSQFPIVKDMLDAFRIGIYEIDGYEADDIIGTVAKKCEVEMDVVIYTGDKDALQLISASTKVAITRKGITEIDLYDENAMFEKYEVTPCQFIDIKGLMGDSSDNIPGVPGIGEKTAVKLIKEFKSVEGVIENIEKIQSRKVHDLIEEYAMQALFCKKLATIVTDVPVEFELGKIKIKEPDSERLIVLFKDLEFKSLAERIPNQGAAQKELEIGKYSAAGMNDISNFIDIIKSQDIISIIFDIKGTDFNNTDIKGIGISWDGMNAVYLPPDHEIISSLKNILENENIGKICHNAKDAYVSLYKHGVDLKGLAFDTAIASYLLNPSENTYKIDELAGRYAGERMPNEKEVLEVFKEKQDREILNNYLCSQSVSIYKLYNILKSQLEENGMLDLYHNVEHPLIEVLASMEIEGFMVDRSMLMELSSEFGLEIDRLTGEIYNLSGEEFNINSPKQLGNILFEKLKLPVIKKTKTGYSTDAEVLEKLAPQHEIVEKILEFRQVMKLKSTYVDGLLNIVGKDNKIHSSFNQTVTATGRISSTEPNLQNIPVKLEMGRRIRKVFVPSSDNNIILSADYSQIELRVLAHIADDINLIDAFYNKLDIHRKTASEVFNVPVNEVTPLMRSRAKAVNFGIVYGISEYGLSRDLKISRNEAKSYIDSYLEKYSGVKKYMEEIVTQAKLKGYVTTVLNRRRYIPEISSTNFTVRSLGERFAMNTPIQGSAADIIKIAMIRVYKRLREEKLKSKLILQVHDELILEVSKDEIDIVKNIVKECMEDAMKLNVPLEVDINTGNNWFDAK